MPLIPFVKNGYFGNRTWIPLVNGNGLTAGGGDEPEPDYETVIGNPISFTTLRAAPLKQLEVAFSPIQSGSGDPSPTNIRPISGWASLTVYHSGADTSNPQTISITIGQTVYSGTLDVVTGVVTVDMASITFDGSEDEDWAFYGSGSASSYAMKCTVMGLKFQNGTIKSNYLQGVAADATWGNYNAFISANSNNRLIAGIKSITTVEAWRTFLNSNNLNVTYLLVTPQTITLTPQEVSSLLGENNVWSTANGDVTVTYRSN